MSLIIDSQLKPQEAIKQNPVFLCPEKILRRQRLLEVIYYSFDGKLHKGQIVIDKDIEQDINDVFRLMRNISFPIESVIPVADSKFNWSDSISVAANNTTGFNFRYKTSKKTMSNHAYGRAVDINPRLNPYIKGNFVEPEGAIYNPSTPGTINKNDQIVQFFKKRGWNWGGDWIDRIDYQHFEKPPTSTSTPPLI